MARIQQETQNLKLLSVSVTPVHDSVPILKEYALRHHADPDRWNITTGKKSHIYQLARKEFFAAYDEGDGGLQDFIHTSNFVLVDKAQQIRGIYDGTKKEEIDRLLTEVKLLN